MGILKPYKDQTPKEKAVNWLVAIGILGIVIVFFVFVLPIILGPGGPSLASTPLEVYERVEVGMDLGQVYDLVDPNYGNEACYVVNCESISSNPVRYTPTSDEFTDYFIWIFMPRSSEAQATALCFYYDASTDDSTVIATAPMAYSEANALVTSYGSRTYWK